MRAAGDGDSADEYAALQHALLAAADAVFPAVLREAITRRPVQRSSGVPAHAPDVACSAPLYAWAALKREAAQRGPWAPDNAVEGAFLQAGRVGLRLVTRHSPGGPLMEADFNAAAALAETWLAAAAEDGALADLAVFAAATPAGGLAFTSRGAFQRQLAAGNLLCPTCGHFFAAERGLREHVQVAHGASFSDARGAEAAARHALVAVGALAGRVGAAASAGDAPPALPGGEDAAAEPPLGSRAAQPPPPPPAAPAAPLHPLLAAAQAGDEAGVRAALAALPAGASASSVCDRRGSGALHYAAGGGHVALLALLAGPEARLDVTAAQRTDGRSAAHWAARNGHTPALAWLASEAGPAAVDAKTADGTTPLHLAAWQGHGETVAWLADTAGADVHAVNDFGCNAAHWAVMGGAVDVAADLAARGVDMWGLNANGHSLLHKAAQRGHAAAVEWLLGGAAGELLGGGAAAVGDGGGGGGGGLHPALGLRHMRPDLRGFTPAAMAAVCGHGRIADVLLGAERRAEEQEKAGATAAACESSVPPPG